MHHILVLHDSKKRTNYINTNAVLKVVRKTLTVDIIFSREMKMHKKKALCRLCEICGCCKQGLFLILTAWFVDRVRRAVAEWLEVHRRPQSTERDKELAARVVTLSRFLPEPLKSQEFLAKFSANLLRDNTLMLGNF